MLAGLILSALLVFQDTPFGWRQALEAGDFKAAWLLTDGEPERVAYYVARSEVLYRAGDPSGSLAVAGLGLRIDPTNLALLYRATGAAIWLENSGDATALSRRLMQAVDSVARARASDDIATWKTRALELLRLSQVLTRRSEEMAHALKRVRAISLGGLTILFIVVAWACSLTYGRSSRPVS